VPVTKAKSAAQEVAKKPSAKSAPTSTKTIAPPRDYNPLDPKRIKELLKRLNANYPDPKCALKHRNAWELTVATILSAQCTDVRVNMVTPELFAK
jgi:endonuclease-3